MTKRVKKPPRATDTDNAYQREYDEWLAKNPPTLVWEIVPNSGGIRRATVISEPVGRPGRAPRPPCNCDLYGRPKHRFGPHHDPGCERREDRR